MNTGGKGVNGIENPRSQDMQYIPWSMALEHGCLISTVEWGNLLQDSAGVLTIVAFNYQYGFLFVGSNHQTITSHPIGTIHESVSWEFDCCRNTS